MLAAFIPRFSPPPRQRSHVRKRKPPALGACRFVPRAYPNHGLVVQDWLDGVNAQPPKFLFNRNAIVWSREYSRTRHEDCKCSMLRATLESLNADRMVVGHTIQSDGVNGACDDQVLRCASLPQRRASSPRSAHRCSSWRQGEGKVEPQPRGKACPVVPSRGPCAGWTWACPSGAGSTSRRH